MKVTMNLYVTFLLGILMNQKMNLFYKYEHKEEKKNFLVVIN